MYTKSEYRQNGDLKIEIKFFKCDICGNEYSEAGVWLNPKQDFHICSSCPFNLCNNLIGCPGLGGFEIFWLKGMIEKMNFFKRKRKQLNPSLRQEILEKYKFKCQTCKIQENLTIDHIKPVSKGGQDVPSNLTVLCRSCNSKKGAKYEN